MKLSAKTALEISKNKSNIKHMSGVEYKAYVRKIMDTYGLEKNDAFRLVRGENVLEIVAKYEG